MTAIRFLLLDFDDTLVPTFAVRAQAWQQAVARVLGRRIDGPAYLRAYLGETIEQSALRLAPNDEPLAARLVAAYRERYFADSTTMITPFPGVIPMLTRLRCAGIRLAVVTSKIRWGVEKELRASGLHEFVEHVVASDDVARHKPHPDALLRALALFDAPADAAAMLGDSDADVLAAHAAGVMAVGALWGAEDEARLRAAAPTALVTRPEDVPPLFGITETGERPPTRPAAGG